MKKVYIDNNIMVNEQYRRKIIDFLKKYCDIVSYATLLDDDYDLNYEEYSKAMRDFSNEFIIEDETRRSRFIDDIHYQNELLNKFHNSENVFEYFDRLKVYDNIELEKINKMLKRYLNNTGNTKYRDTITLPNESFIGSKFTVKSHCTIGGLYKIYEFIMDQNMIDYLIQHGELTKMNCFQNDTMLEDPGFYKLNQLICSICSHEQTYTFFLDDEQIITLKETDIPFSYD